MKTISVLRPLELFEVANKLQNIITNESGLTRKYHYLNHHHQF